MFVPGEFDYKDLNFDENRSKYRNDPIKMKKLRKAIDGRDCGVYVAGYAKYISEGIGVPSVDFVAKYHRMRYASLLQNCDLWKAEKCYVSDNNDPPRPRTKNASLPDETGIVSIE
ncbi:hypothetical protein CQW23_20488 [Capsicum baccatum]|uniref:Ubiquitin-like protease family profile domain-containing protein n=1 Tax=Capsicum baccatum TaxID=33114 RepID=A0A2G2W8S3_CAPBA|nr:hypothetical protein CQW23_20488 [Capsicum baccatum]